MPQQLAIPVAAVLGIYARETGQGMIFGDEDRRRRRHAAPETPPASRAGAKSAASKPRPKLKVVK